MIFCPKCGGVMEEQLIPWFGSFAHILTCTQCGYRPSWDISNTTNTTEVEP